MTVSARRLTFLFIAASPAMNLQAPRRKRAICSVRSLPLLDWVPLARVQGRRQRRLFLIELRQVLQDQSLGKRKAALNNRVVHLPPVGVQCVVPKLQIALRRRRRRRNKHSGLAQSVENF